MPMVHVLGTGTLPCSPFNAVSDTIPSHNKPDETVQAPDIQFDQARPGSSTNRQGTCAISGRGLGLVREPLSANHSEKPLTAARFKHHVTEGHSVITGREREPLRCEDEPIHAPGAVQGFGMLIALTEEEPGRFVVRLASENSGEFIGYTPAQLFGLRNITEILSEEQQDNLQTHIDSIRDDVDNVTLNGPEIFNTSITNPAGERVKLWCGTHINPSRPDLIVCEFEREDDPDYPLTPDSSSNSNRPTNTLISMPTEEGVVKSTRTTTKPLRVPHGARLGKSTSNPMQIFDSLGKIQDQLAEATSIDGLLRTLVGIVKELTTYHRVMVYQFDSSYNGKVVTELVDAGHSEELYYGLQFPASDMPPQARELYKINKMRLLYDRDLPTATMVCRSRADLDTPLDMTYCYLRAMSPIHLKHLANVGVQSSMSLSLKVFGELWGLVSCHGVGPAGMRPPFPIRKMCKLISNVASGNLERLSYKTSLQAQKLINSRVVNNTNGSEHLVVSKDELLKMFEADFGVVSILGETKTLDRGSQCQESLAMLEYLRVKKPSGVIASHDITTDFPDLQYTPGFNLFGGMLYVPLSVDGESFMVLFRKAQFQEIKWGGNPYKNKFDGGPGPLESRKSSKTCLEVVTGRSREWTTEQIELATALCAAYGKHFMCPFLPELEDCLTNNLETGKLIQAWEQKESSSDNGRLTQLLLANSAHQVRTPLNAIINYLEIALKGLLDKETRDNLVQSHLASKSLVCVINDLLDLTKTEEGRALARDEVFDLPECIRQATYSFLTEAKRKNLCYDVEMHSELPKNIYGDKLQVRQAIAGVVANACQNTSDGFVQVTSYVAEADDGRVRVEIAVQDSGVGMSTEDMDRLFHDLEQVGDVEESGKHREGQKLGLGLAVVARIVRNMDGLLRVNSEPGQGSCFVLQLPFDLPDGPESLSKGQYVALKHGRALAATKTGILARTPSYSSAEITLVPRANSLLRTTSRGTNNGSQVGRSRPRAGSTADAENREEICEPRGPLDQRMPLAGAQVPEVSVLEESITDAMEEGTPTPPPVLMPAKPNAVVSTGTSKGSAEPVRLQILIAEDNPVNVMFLRKRLEKLGHQIHHSINGEDCAMVYRHRSHAFDVVLMDLQMPVMDGIAGTKAIRAWERDPSHPGLSHLARRNGKIPVFAVSASLVEENREVYMEAGFDGWIPKPVDFGRLCTIVAGITDEESRTACLYRPGKWEVGGWFEKAREVVG